MTQHLKEGIGVIAMFAGLTIASFAPEFSGKYVLSIVVSAIGSFYALGCHK